VPCGSQIYFFAVRNIFQEQADIFSGHELSGTRRQLEESHVV
jgi:hypothetical protein